MNIFTFDGKYLVYSHSLIFSLNLLIIFDD